MIQFDLPKGQSSIIKVIGVGGGGSNAVNHMYSQDIEGVDFIICNTDAQAVAQSKVPNKIQLGPSLTQGLGAGANPAIGRQAMEESLEEIKKILEVNTKMAFITAGMGGGTGTGGAPILAKICKDLGILTVGIVTTPFAYEGKRRIAQAEEGIMQLKNSVDTLLVISNDKLRHQFGNLKMKEAFAKADNVLATAAKCITDVINTTGQINVDFADVCTVMLNGGVAILGSANAEGENRAQVAIENALNSPLLNDNDIRGAKWILININSAEGEFEFTMDEVEIIQDYLLSHAGDDTDVILGLGYDNTLGSEIGITLIATGFEHKDPFAKTEKQLEQDRKENEKIVMPLEMPPAQTAALKKVAQPSFAFADEKKVQIEMVQEPKPDPLMPTLCTEEIKPEVRTEKATEDEKPVFFEISSAADQAPAVAFLMDPIPQKPKEEKREEKPSVVQFLAKPEQIYAEPKKVDEPAAEQPKINIDKPAAEPTKAKFTLPDEAPLQEMRLVEKTQSEKSTKVQDAGKTATPGQQRNSSADNSIPDETEQLRKRAEQRLSKLRSLSFNINANDPNDEFENVPAYLRRNMEMHNQIAEVENFYSSYMVKNDKNDQPEIDTINTFLNGEKPD